MSQMKIQGNLYGINYPQEFSEDEFLKEHSIENAKEIIAELTLNKVFLDGKFDDDSWVLINNKELNIRKYFNFQDILDTEIKIKAKCWILNYLLTVAPSSATVYLNNLKIFLLLTNYLSCLDIDEIEASLNEFKLSVRYNVLISGINFLDYIYGSQVTKSKIELFSNQLRSIVSKFFFSNTRDLPPYKDIIRFSFILTSFSNVWDEKLELKFFPVLLWWKLTSVIPMRPSEFCSIKRNCLSIQGNDFFITLPRQKQKATSKTFEVPNTLPISKELYNLIKRYIHISDSYGETTTLISAAVYRSTLNYPTQSKRRILNQNHFFLYMFNNLLHAFYSEVLKDIYGLEPIDKSKWLKEKNSVIKLRSNDGLSEFTAEKQIIKVQPNDTRHFAICSMMIQGFNPLTIARMAGHQHIESQYHYQKHIEFFIDSKAYEATLLNRLTNSSRDTNYNSTLVIKDLINRSLAPEEMFEYKEEVEIGYCTDELRRCESRICIFCSKNWIPREEIESNFKEIVELKTEYSKKLKIRAHTLSRIYKDIKIEYKSCRVNPLELAELARESKLTNSEIHDYAVLISKIFE
ncbi:Phage integrase family protein [Bacillus cereus]|nr:Phage integrase family protein [Bacillus cereus]